MKFLLSIIIALSPLCSFAEGIFVDVSDSHKNVEAIEYLQKRGIISGYSDGTFRPADPVNRVEALKILIISAGISADSHEQTSLGFIDTSESAWYARYLSIGKNLGIVKGYSDSSFKPGNTVNLAESLKMLLETNNIVYNKSISEPPYYDVPLSAWFTSYLTFAKENGLLDSPSDGNINPGKSMNRGEFAEIIYRFLKVNEKNEEQFKDNAEMYPTSFVGQVTDSGETYPENELTATHRSLSFGTRVKVTNQKNGKSIIVKINDKNIENPDREIMLSKKAFYAISSGGEKLLSVKIEEINTDAISDSQTSDSCTFPSDKGKIKKDFFTNISLTKDINAFFRENEVYNISGTANGNPEVVNIFIINSDGTKRNFEGKTNNGFFSIDVDMQDAGEKQIGIIPGNNGVSLLANIDVKKIDCEKNFSETYNVKPTNLTYKIKNGDVYLKWNGTGSLIKVLFKQGSNQIVKYINKSDDYLKIDPAWFRNFAVGEAYYQISLTSLSGDYSFDQSKSWSVSDTQKVNIVDHHYYYIDPSVVEISSIPSTYAFGGSIQFSGRNKDDIKTQADIILPNNNVESIELSSSSAKIKNSNGIETFPKLSKIDFSYSPNEHGTYIIEINHISGVAGLNIPIYEEGFLPLIPDYRDLNDQQDSIKNLDVNKLRSQLIAMVNKERSLVGAQKLVLNPSLNQLAQDKANDIVQRNYFSHWNPDGKTLNDLRFNYAIKTQISENLAKDASLDYAHSGLMRSAAHRKNILDKDWTRCGFGFSISSDGTLNVVEAFSPSPITETSIDSLRNEIVDKINLKRSAYLSTSSVLHALAQNWSEDMANKGFDDFTNPSGITLSSKIREAGITSMFSSFIVSHYSFKGGLDEILKSIETDKQKSPFDSAWKKIGVGIAQDNSGNIKITLIYTN